MEGSQLAPQHLSKLIIVIAIAYTSATLQGKKIVTVQGGVEER